MLNSIRMEQGSNGDGIATTDDNNVEDLASRSTKSRKQSTGIPENIFELSGSSLMNPRDSLDVRPQFLADMAGSSTSRKSSIEVLERRPRHMSYVRSQSSPRNKITSSSSDAFHDFVEAPRALTRISKSNLSDKVYGEANNNASGSRQFRMSPWLDSNTYGGSALKLQRGPSSTSSNFPRSLVRHEQQLTLDAINDQRAGQNDETAAWYRGSKLVQDRPQSTSLQVHSSQASFLEARVNTVRDCFCCRRLFAKTWDLLNHIELGSCRSFRGVFSLYQAIRRIDTGYLITIPPNLAELPTSELRQGTQLCLAPPKYHARIERCTPRESGPSSRNKTALERHLGFGQHDIIEDPTDHATGFRGNHAHASGNKVPNNSQAQQEILDQLRQGDAITSVLENHKLSQEWTSLEDLEKPLLYACGSCRKRFNCMARLNGHFWKSPPCEKWYWDADTGVLSWEELLKAALNSSV
ncbi:hypothetical protein ABW21_db0204646 [Orbilia brochopaga]|nr:hypothetical protein ABW21_db0204646 [Drechslerella brochopaga]